MLRVAVADSVSMAGVLRRLGIVQSGGLHAHISGDYLDCRAVNLRFLCPSCHAQTPTHSGKNKERRSYAEPAPADQPQMMLGPAMGG
jgi:hypothetical protein